MLGADLAVTFAFHVDTIRYIALLELFIAAGFLLGLMARGPGRRSGLTLYGFGSSYLLLIALGIAEITGRIGTEPTWRTILAFTSGTVAAVTMVLMYRHDTHNGRPHLLENKHHSRKA